MSDMDPMIELKAAFLEECDELLASLELRLTALRDGSVSNEDVNGAFRAIHSIKGGAGAFAMPRLVELAHVFEAALDHVRAGRVPIQSAPHGLFLRTLDHVAALVGDVRQGVDSSAPPELIHELKQIGPQDSAPKATATAPAPQAAAKLVIEIRPHRDLFRRAVDPRHAFAELEAFGALTVTTLIEGLPDLAALDPAECRLAFRLSLDTAAPVARIAELLALHFDEDEFSLNGAVSQSPPEQAPVATSESIRLPQASIPNSSIAPSPATPSSIAQAPIPQLAAPPIPASPIQAPRSALQGAPPAAAPAGKARQTGGSIRVDLDRIDRLMNLVGEIVITQSMLDQRLLSLPVGGTVLVADSLQVLGRQTRELQESVMAVRAQPVKNVFQRMPRLVRELAMSLGKQVRLQIIGEDTEVDKTIIEELADPLTHMIRNAMDHGMETPDERRASGKPPEGLVTLQAEQRSGRIVISVSDDGRGINRDKLLAKARSRGLLGDDERPSNEEIDAFLFHPGLSTAEAVTDVSGRGVGMDVVKQNVEALGGRIVVTSQTGQGSRFTLLLPLTLAVMDGMIVKASGHRLVLPIASVRETLQSIDLTVERLPGGQRYLRLRNRLSPLVSLGEILGFGRSPHEQVIVMTETDRGSQIGLLVDEIIGQQQVVVKSLEAACGRVPGASAGTILGDGLVALIVDIDALPAMTAPAVLAVPAHLH